MLHFSWSENMFQSQTENCNFAALSTKNIVQELSLIHDFQGWVL